MSESYDDLVEALRARGGQVELPYGWEKLVAGLVELLKQHSPGFTVQQVKEKFGGLRFYYESGAEDMAVRDTMAELVLAAEKESYSLCQVCGAPGELRSGNWLSTLCGEHA